MHNHHPCCTSHHHPCHNATHAGLVGVIGGLINLTTTALYGGTRIVRTIVEGAVWHAEHPPYYHGCHHSSCCCQQHHSCCDHD